MFDSPSLLQTSAGEGGPDSVVLVLFGLLALAALSMVGHRLAKRAMGDKAGGFEVAVVAGALTLTLAIAQGLVLHAVGALHATGWFLSIGVLAFVATLSLGWSDRSRSRAQSQIPALGRRNAVLIAVAACVAVLAIQQARSGAFAHREFDFTEFWLLQDGDKGANQFVLGLANHERETVSYAVDILVDGRLLDIWTDIQVEDGNVWVTTLNVPARTGSGRRIEVLLYKNGDRETVYRRVWVDDRA